MFTPYHINAWDHATVLLGEPDAIPDSALRAALNVRLDRTLRVIEPRPGWSRVLAAPLGGPLVFIAELVEPTVVFGYAQVNNTLKRLTISGIVDVVPVGPQVLSFGRSPDGLGHVWAYFVNNAVAIQDDGTQTLPLGVLPATAPPLSAVLADDLTLLIDDGNNASLWTGTNVTMLQDQTGTYITPPSSISFRVAPSTTGSIARGISSDLNLDTVLGGDDTVKNDDYISFWVITGEPNNIAFLQVDIDIDSNTTNAANAFVSNYFSIRLGALSAFDGAVGAWRHVKIRKARFARVGVDTSRGWATVRAFRFVVQTLAGIDVDVGIDDLRLRGGVGIEGDIEYTICYKSSITGARGNPPKDSDDVVQYTTKVTTDRQRLVVDLSNVIQGGANFPVADTHIDTIMLWRRGGIFTTAVLVAELPITTPALYTDTTSDATLVLTNKLLETDNDPPPTGDTRVLFGPNASGNFFMIVNGQRIYISKPYEDKENRVENWPKNAFMIAGDGVEEALAGATFGTQTRVWTSARTYNVVGVGLDTFLPVAIDGSRGIVGPLAWATGDGLFFFVSQDGIWQDANGRQAKLTNAIDPFFQGITVGDVTPLGVPGRDTRLAYLHQPRGALLCMTFANGTIVLKPNLDNGLITEPFFNTSRVTQLRSLWTSSLARILYAGGADGHLYTIEEEALYTDAGVAIDWVAETKSYDLGQPQHEKLFASFTVEGQTNGQRLDVVGLYNRQQVNSPIGSVTTASETGLVILPSPTPTTPYHDVALRISGSTNRRVAITRLGCLFEPQPELMTFLDSGNQTFDFMQQCKRLEWDYTLPGDSVLTLYFDGQQLILTELATGGRVNRPTFFPPGLRGRVWRFTLLSSTPFKVWRMSGFFKQLGTDQHYSERRLVQGV